MTGPPIEFSAVQSQSPVDNRRKRLFAGLSALLKRLLQLFLFYLNMLWLGIMLLSGNLACLTLLPLPAHWRKTLMQWFISRLFRLFLGGMQFSGLMKLDLAALDALNGEQRLILVANHPSMIDVFLIISRVKNGICLMKARIGVNLFFAIGSRMAGYISNAHSELLLRQAAEKVAAGALLLAFPEGTRTVRQPVNDLKPGVALIARRAGAPMQSILLTTNSAYLSKGWGLFRPPRFPLLYRARLGERFSPGADAQQTSRRLQSYFESQLERSIDPALELP